jgi:cellulose biosynthesis protein BcsQ
VHILVLASQKGGTGKTTLSGHLAVEAQKAGVGPVALIDTDPQGSLSNWWNARAAPEPLFVKVGPSELGKALEHLTRSGIRLAVIDTPPAITESISYVIGHADLVILPTRPSPHDLRAVGPTPTARANRCCSSSTRPRSVHASLAKRLWRCRSMELWHPSRSIIALISPPRWWMDVRWAK